MQHFGASLLTLLGLVNGLQCTEVNVGHNTWLSEPRVKLEVHPRIEEWPQRGTGKKLVLHKKNEPLNMTCTVVPQNGEQDDDTPFNYIVDWKGPRHLNDNPKIKRGQSKNTAWIWFEHVAEKDAGDYTCVAVSHETFGQQTTLYFLFYLFVEHKPTYCGSQWFRCHSRNCIMERYVCDGKQDCEEGEDESPSAGCGDNPCIGKVLCEDRCIPPEWCCDHHNCTGTFGLRPWPHENHEISYVQTAFYTVIGCAMAFMFIVTILVIAICRVQIKRAMNSRCSQQNRNVTCGRRTVPLYDLDVYLNRTADVNYPGGVSIMYNINSGVQFVGRPTEPPPYSEVIAEPPREGPPPPYVSCENLIVRVPNPRFIENTEIPMSAETAASMPSNHSATEIIEESPPDTDIRHSRSGVSAQRVNSSPNVAVPQVPTYTCQGHVNSRESTNFTRIPTSAESDNVDSPRIAGVGNFELEYVETDALLSDNSTLNVATVRSKDAINWKPYNRHALAKSRWLSNERRSTEKNWYRQRFDKPKKECPSREATNHKDSENEGVFLDTDQQQDSPISDGNSSFRNIVENTPIHDENIPSCSNSDVAESTIINDPCKGTEIVDDRNDVAVETSKKLERKFTVDEKTSIPTRASKKNVTRSFFRGMKRQSSLNNEATTPRNLSETTACASSVDLPNSRLVDDSEATNSQIRHSSHVLPLRESFIGVQRDS